MVPACTIHPHGWALRQLFNTPIAEYISLQTIHVLCLTTVQYQGHMLTTLSIELVSQSANYMSKTSNSKVRKLSQ